MTFKIAGTFKLHRRCFKKNSFLKFLPREAILLPVLKCLFSSSIASMKHIGEKEEVESKFPP